MRGRIIRASMALLVVLPVASQVAWSAPGNGNGSSAEEKHCNSGRAPNGANQKHCDGSTTTTTELVTTTTEAPTTTTTMVEETTTTTMVEETTTTTMVEETTTTTEPPPPGGTTCQARILRATIVNPQSGDAIELVPYRSNWEDNCASTTIGGELNQLGNGVVIGVIPHRTGDESADVTLFRAEAPPGWISLFGSRTDCSGGDAWFLRAQPDGQEETRVGDPDDENPFEAGGIFLLDHEGGYTSVLRVEAPTDQQLTFAESEVHC